MAHIAGLTYVTNNQVFCLDEGGGGHVFEASAGINATTAAVSVGQLIDPDFRVYVGTSDGKVALFAGGRLTNPPQLFQVTNQLVYLSLYHAAGVIYVGTGNLLSLGPGSVIALDDLTFAPRWEVAAGGLVSLPVGVAYEGSVPKQVIFTNGNPNPSVTALDVITGAEVWSVPEPASGQKVHEGVVYYGNWGGDNTLRARSASDGTLLWKFTNPSNFNFNTPVVAGGVVWASSAGNQLFALQAGDGSVLWEATVNGHPGIPVLFFEHDYYNVSLVAVAEQAENFPGYLRAFDANTGAELWTSSMPVAQAGELCTDPILIPAENGHQIQIGIFEGALMTFNAFNGQLTWQKNLTPGSQLVAKPHWVNW